jgi:iron complex transport system permease protein
LINGLQSNHPQNEWRKRYIIALTFFSVAAFFGVTASLVLGKGLLSLPSLLADGELARQIILEIRAPRMIAAIFIGLSLALSGLLLQTHFRNPLADPYILGVSSGAALGAVVKLIFLSAVPIPLAIFAIIGGAGLVVIAWLVARGVRGDITITLLLSGVALSILAGSLLAISIMSARPGELTMVIRWLMGTLAGAGFSESFLVMGTALFGMIIAMYLGRELNALHLGSVVAQSVGVNVKRTQFIAVALATLLASVCVAVAGVIGFIGLIVPHMCRLISGGDVRNLIPLVSIAGAAILIWCDVISRIALPSGELPIGAVTAVVGVPFFLWLMIKGRFLA